MIHPNMNSTDPGAQARLYCLGTAIVHSKHALEVVVTGLVPSDFENQQHRRIFEAMHTAWQARGQMEPEELLIELRRDEQIETAPLWDLMDWGTLRTRPETLVRMVRDSRQSKMLAQQLSDYALEALSTHERPSDFARRLIVEISDYAISGHHGDLTPFLEIGKEWVASTNEPLEARRIPTGFGLLDHLLTGGFQYGSLNFIAGRPGIGKSAFALCIAVHAARKNRRVAVFSLEMSKAELYGRVLSATVGLSSNIIARRIRTRDWEEQERDRVVNAFGGLNELPLQIDDSGGIGLEEIASKCRRECARDGLDLVVVDYVQLMATSSRKNTTRSEEVGQLSRGLKALAKEIKVAVIALSQLNRQATHERPAMRHLRDSGELEQDADFIGYLWRNERRKDPESIVELHVLKQRSGPADVMIPLYFKKDLTLFTEAEMHQQPPVTQTAKAKSTRQSEIHSGGR